ncbi:MAG: VPLPA-CTERM sorting domain-containing protein [Pseudomonadota bacterium]
MTSSSTTSVKLDNTNSWIAAPLLAEGTFGQKLLGNTTGTQGAIGTAMSFYYETSSQLNSFSNTATTLAQAAGQWLLSNDTLTFSSPTSQVPLPAGLPLLLSGLAAMGLFGRRSKGGALQAAV